MNKIKIFSIVFFGLLLMSCRQGNTKDISQETSGRITDYSPTQAVTDSPETQCKSIETRVMETLKIKDQSYKNIFPDNYPDIDGSTSATNLDAAIHAAYLDLDFSEVKTFTKHTTTYQSFNNLITHKIDAIYTVPVSESQLSKAEEAGFKLESVAVAKEGFVFIVNKNNPVESLTQDQIRSIYAGEITNWSEVGGNDAQIVTYDRNYDSGSMNYMKEFMGEKKYITSRKSPLSSMFSAIEVISEQDDGENSITYSVFSYASDFEKSTQIKMISIDGVAPNEASFRDNSYPILSCTYFMFSADEPENSEIRKLADFISSDKGQQAAESAGYISIR